MCATTMRDYFYLTLLLYGKCALTSYGIDRAEIIQQESYMSLGGDTTLSDQEILVNNCLMKHKYDEVDYGFRHPEFYNFSRHFFTYKDRVKESKVYKIIKALPKGAVLHIHDTSMMNPDYLLNITYADDLYVCLRPNYIKMKFANTIPNTTCSGDWQLMKGARAASENLTKFDQEIRKRFTLVVDNPEIVYPSITETWISFREYFSVVGDILSYRPVFEQYTYDALKMLRNENVMYAEIRTTLPNLYDLDGTKYGQDVTAKVYKKTIHRFKKDYPDFIGAKIIYTPNRKVDMRTIENYIETARKAKKDVPEIFAGFDLAGQESLGVPLIKFAPLLEAADDLNFFFHAGETNWYGTDADMNLIDAVLLGTKRIGHAYTLVKHPAVMAAVKERNIGLEVNVVSNSVLSLVRDLRNHPLSILLAQGMPIVLSSDDPGAWEADGLSNDFYAAFVGVASRQSDLRLLKTLALNSLKYSALEKVEKQKALRLFNVRWNEFVNGFNCSLY